MNQGWHYYEVLRHGAIAGENNLGCALITVNTTGIWKRLRIKAVISPWAQAAAQMVLQPGLRGRLDEATAAYSVAALPRGAGAAQNVQPTAQPKYMLHNV